MLPAFLVTFLGVISSLAGLIPLVSESSLLVNEVFLQDCCVCDPDLSLPFDLEGRLPKARGSLLVAHSLNFDISRKTQDLEETCKLNLLLWPAGIGLFYLHW